jgi:GTPase SAR1 family protein
MAVLANFWSYLAPTITLHRNIMGLTFTRPKKTVAVCGLDAAGKTCLLFRLENSESSLPTTMPTIGIIPMSFKLKDHDVDALDVTANFTTRGPLKRNSHSLANCQAMLFVINVNDLEEERLSSRSERGEGSVQELFDTCIGLIKEGAPVLFVLTRCNAENSQEKLEFFQKLLKNQIDSKRVVKWVTMDNDTLYGFDQLLAAISEILSVAN